MQLFCKFRLFFPQMFLELFNRVKIKFVIFANKLVFPLQEFLLSRVSYSVVFEVSINYINKRTIHTCLRHSNMVYRQHTQT